MQFACTHTQPWLTGVAADEMLDHQAEVAGAYKSSKSKFGASSAYGQDLVLDIGLLDPDQDELLEEPDN